MRLNSFHRNAICIFVQVFKFFSETATGNILVVASGFLTVFGKFLSDKLDTYQAETRKEQAETRKEQAGLSGKLDTYQTETRKELSSITQALNSVAVQLTSIQTNMEWIRGDYGGAYRGSSPLVQGTISSTQPAREEKSFPEGEGDFATSP
jgi:hypothetical protein